MRPRGTPPRVRDCPECGHPFYPGRPDQKYCRPTCRTTYHRRRADRGAALHDIAYAWRAKRGKGDFGKVTAKVYGWIREERARERKHRKMRAAAA